MNCLKRANRIFILCRRSKSAGGFIKRGRKRSSAKLICRRFDLNQISEIKQFTFPTTRTLEPLRDENEKIVGVIVRTQQEIFGVIESHIHKIENQNVYKLTVKIKNQTEFENAGEQSRDDALMHSLVSTHTILSDEKRRIYFTARTAR